MAVWQEFTNQTQWKQYLKELVKYNDRALYKAIILIYQNQTEEEQQKNRNLEDNRIGFTKLDAEEMSIIARKIIAGQKLTESEISKSKNKMQKYWKQLMVISKENIRQRELKDYEEGLKEDYKQRVQTQIEQEILRQHDEVVRRCIEEGISCDYGICDECLATTKRF